MIPIYAGREEGGGEKIVFSVLWVAGYRDVNSSSPKKIDLN